MFKLRKNGDLMKYRLDYLVGDRGLERIRELLFDLRIFFFFKCSFLFNSG